MLTAGLNVDESRGKSFIYLQNSRFEEHIETRKTIATLLKSKAFDEKSAINEYLTPHSIKLFDLEMETEARKIYCGEIYPTFHPEDDSGYLSDWTGYNKSDCINNFFKIVDPLAFWNTWLLRRLSLCYLRMQMLADVIQATTHKAKQRLCVDWQFNEKGGFLWPHIQLSMQLEQDNVDNKSILQILRLVRTALSPLNLANLNDEESTYHARFYYEMVCSVFFLYLFFDFSG